MRGRWLLERSPEPPKLGFPSLLDRRIYPRSPSQDSRETPVHCGSSLTMSLIEDTAG